MTPGIYSGNVVHQRFAPRRHRLQYRIFQVLLDLDRLDEDLRGLKLMSRNRFNLFGIRDSDHGPDQADHSASLRDRMIAMLKSKALYTEGDRLFLLTMPRVLGFVFNPICLYFIADGGGALKAVVYEVNNTFGDRHSYVMPVAETGGPIHQSGDKRLHVSPFMDTHDMKYDFDLIEPAETFVLKINLRRRQADTWQTMLFAGFTARKFPLTDAVLWRQFVAMPLMTFKVVAGIHWEALKIALKGIGLKPKPPTPRSSVSVNP